MTFAMLCHAQWLKAKVSDFIRSAPMAAMAVVHQMLPLLALLGAAEVSSNVQEAMDVMSHLTVAMVTEVLDADLLDLRSNARAERQLLRLGNTGKVAKDVTWKGEC